MKMMKKTIAALASLGVAGAAVLGTASMSASADGKSEPPYSAWLAASIGSDQQWNAGDWGDAVTTFSESGSYTVTATIPEEGGSENIEFLSLETDINVYAFVAEGGDYKTEGTLKLAVDRIYIGHFDGTTTELTYTGPGDLAYCTRDDGSSARLNILNEWGGPVQMTTDIPKDLPGGIMAGETINIDFTVSGIEAGNGEATDTNEESSADDNGGDTNTTTEGPESSTDPTNAPNDDNNQGGGGDAGADNNSNNDDAENSDSGDTNTGGGNTNTGGGNTNTGGGSNNSGSSNNAGGGSNSGGTSNNSTTSETGDVEVAAVALGAVAAAALGLGAFTITRRRK